jgi:hypothetical protein
MCPVTVYNIVAYATFLSPNYTWILTENDAGSNANEVFQSSTGHYKAIIGTKCTSILHVISEIESLLH